MDCSTLGFPVLYHLLEFAETRVHRVGDAIQPSHPLSWPGERRKPYGRFFLPELVCHGWERKEAIGIPVETGSSESTAIGNVMMQAKWAGVVNTISDMRTMIRESLDDRKRYEPQDEEAWKTAYEKYLNVYKEL